MDAETKGWCIFGVIVTAIVLSFIVSLVLIGTDHSRAMQTKKLEACLELPADQIATCVALVIE